MSAPQVQYRFRWPKPTPTVIAFAALLSATWLLGVLSPWAREFMSSQLAVNQTTLPSLRLWSLVTHLIWRPDFIGLLLDVVIFYLFAADLEAEVGRRRVLTVFFSGALLSALGVALFTWALKPGVLLGISAATMAVIAAYCRLRWEQELSLFFIPMTGKLMFSVFLGIGVMFPLMSGNPHLALAELLGAAGGFVGTVRLRSLNRSIKDIKLRYHAWRVRRNMRLIARAPEHDPKRRRDDGTWIN